MEKSFTSNTEEWDSVIEPRKSLLNLDLKEVWQYRDLLTMIIKRDIVTVYKQTVLGPVWFVVQPILTTAVFILVFGKIANISTDNIPPVLFYLAGIIIWNFFSECFTKTSVTFRENANLFGKVYFPRLIMPLAKVASGLIKFGIQMILFLSVYFYFLLSGNETIQPMPHLIFLPVMILIMAGLGLGLGIIFSSMTTKYRDLSFVIDFGVRLLMYATPIIYPISTIPEKYRIFILANPLSSVVEGFKFMFLGQGVFSWEMIGYSALFMLIILYLGILVFNKTEKTFMDTV